MSKAHNELILILDELAEIDPHQLKPTIYMLGNGQTKSRANQNGDAIAKKFFSIVFLSNGEETLEAIASKAGETLKAGQEVRLIEIDADAGLGMGIIQELHDFKNSDSLISEIENNFNQFYGVAGKAFLENISEMKSNDEHALMNTIKCYQNSFDSHLRESSNPQVGRVQNSFSFIAAIGELAIELEILPFNKGEMESAVLEVFNLWKNSRDRTILSDEERALDQVRYFFEVNGDARFSTYNLEENGTASSERSYQKAGFRGEHQGEACWLVFPQVFRKEVCKGHSTKNVARVLKKKGLLLCDNDGAPFISKTIGSKTFRVYAVRERILEK